MANSVCSAATAVNSSCILSALDHYARRGSGKYEKEALHTASKRACRPASGLEAGLWLEFGVAHGGSTKIILQQLTRSTCSVSRKKLYAFDSFLGLPETWRQPDAHVRGGENISRCCLGAGAFARKGLPPFHNPNVEWRIGWFNESLSRFLSEPVASASEVSFLHMDADLYSSTDTVLRLLQPKLSRNAVLVFDELINYPEFEQHEMRALLELQRRSGRSLRVVSTPAIKVVTLEWQLREALRHWRAEYPHAGKYMQQAAFELL